MSITTHVLDTAQGRPASGVPIELEIREGTSWRKLGQGETDSDGRLRMPLSGEISHNVANAARNIVAEIHGEFGDVAAALAQAAVSYEGTFTTQRVQHAALETHGGLAWVDADGILNVRSSTQVPFLTRRTLADLFGLPPDKVRALTALGHKVRFGPLFGSAHSIAVAPEAMTGAADLRARGAAAAGY